MIIARAREKDNIAEYILYMWQIEDLIRAANFDLEYINQTVISKFDLPEKVLSEMRKWYKDLINNMLSEGLKTKGHLSFLVNLMERLGHIHLELIENDAVSRDLFLLYSQEHKSIQTVKASFNFRIKGFS